MAGTGAGAARARRRRGGLDAADIFIAGSGARRAARARHLQIDLNIFINVRRDLSLISRQGGGGGGREVTNGPSLDQNLLKGVS